MQYLSEGNIPDDPDAAQDNPSDQLRETLAQDPATLETYIRAIEQSNPEEGVEVRAHPEEFLQRLGLDPASFPAGLLDSIRNGTAQAAALPPRTQQQPAGAPVQRTSSGGLLGQFSETEKDEIKGLQGLGTFSLPQVVQIYLACDKQVERAAGMLFDVFTG
jgi:hypothetical protein